MIRAVVFDLGGVVIDFTNRSYYEYLSEISKSSFQKIKRMIESKQLPLLERGRIDLHTFEKHVSKKLEIDESKVKWYKYYAETVGLNYDVLELVRILHKEYITAFMSNIDRTRYSYTLRILDLGLFDYKFSSCYVGARKPSQHIYLYALKRMKLKSNQVVFIDDRIENVKGARKVGITGIQFKNRRSLDIALYKLGL